MAGFFTDVPDRIAFGGLESTDPLTFKVYEPDRVVLGKRMEDHLRVAVCLWHSFNWPGSDVFGVGTFDRPWLLPGSDPMEAARAKVDAAFEFVAKLGVPFFTFHDRDVAPEGGSFAETRDRLQAVVDDIEAHMERTGIRLLWGTANLFSHPRYAAGAATNPDPEVFAYAAAQVKHMLETTHRLRRANYVLWGGREGYETLLNTDLAREEAQLARFLDPRRGAQASDRVHRDAAARAEAPGADEAPVRLRLRDGRCLPRAPRPCGRVPGQHRGEPRNAGRPQLRARGRGRAQPRHLRQHRHEPRRPAERLGHRPVPELGRRARDRRATRSCARAASRRADSTSTPSSDVRAWIGSDLFHAHIGGIDTLARALLVAADLLDAGGLSGEKERRYAGWDGGLGRELLEGGLSLPEIEARIVDEGIEPRPRSGGQERLENLVNQRIWSTDRSR